jgi:hypothetical protein
MSKFYLKGISCSYYSSSLPGYNSFAHAREAGADMRDADKRWVAETLTAIRAAKMPPAIVENPLKF